MLRLYPVYLLWNRRKTLTGSPDPMRANSTLQKGFPNGLRTLLAKVPYGKKRPNGSVLHFQ